MAGAAGPAVADASYLCDPATGAGTEARPLPGGPVHDPNEVSAEDSERLQKFMQRQVSLRNQSGQAPDLLQGRRDFAVRGPRVLPRDPQQRR